MVLQRELPAEKERRTSLPRTEQCGRALPVLPVALGLLQQLWVYSQPLWGQGMVWPWGCSGVRGVPMSPPPAPEPFGAELGGGQEVLSTPMWAGGTLIPASP